MKKKSWKTLVKQMDAGKLCTNDWFNKWFYGCWKKYENSSKDAETELWWAGVIKYYNKVTNE